MRKGPPPALDLVSFEEQATWRPYANCLGVDSNIFHPQRGETTEAARGVCRGCVVRMPCLEYAITTRQKWGIWGGLSERERRRIRDQRDRSAS